MEKENLCPNCGIEIESVYCHLSTNSDDTYFKICLDYCPKCKYIDSLDANL